MKNIMKKAHKMTKEIKEQYPEVDYQAQLGLCLSFLAQEGEEKMEGTEKQIAYATSLREKQITRFQRIADRKARKENEGIITLSKNTYKIRKTGEKLELTKVEALQTAIKILQNMTKAWEIINACESNEELIIRHYGQYR